MAIVTSACGPITATTALRDARDAVDRADRVEAEVAATYEFVSAVEYLEKAREEWHYSDFQRALEYARRAKEFAEAAYDRAMQSNTNLPGVESVPDDI